MNEATMGFSGGDFFFPCSLPTGYVESPADLRSEFYIDFLLPICLESAIIGRIIDKYTIALCGI